MLFRLCKRPLQVCISRCSSTNLANGSDLSEDSLSEIQQSIKEDAAVNLHDELPKKDTPPVAKPYLSPELLKYENMPEVVREVKLKRYDATDIGDWTNHWPAQAPFNPYLVPLPIRMGWAQNKCVVPDKFANLELMKVQNFLHLTPPAIEKHCHVLKQFCTPFPSELKSDEACEKAFPLETHSVDYVFAGNTPRTPKARTITKKVRLCNLVLHEHARIKFIKLLGDQRYDRNSDIATIKAERCPMKHQNSDFCDYVLTALYFESWKKEKWETRENMDDYDYYYWWEDSMSQQSLKRALADSLKVDEISNHPNVQAYRKAVTSIKQEPSASKVGELTEDRMKILDDYKESVLKVLNLQQIS